MDRCSTVVVPVHHRCPRDPLVSPPFVACSHSLRAARETPDMIASMGAWGTFLLFSMFNFLSAVFGASRSLPVCSLRQRIWADLRNLLLSCDSAFFFIPETKGKSLEEMDDLFGVKRIDADGPKVASEQQFVEDNKAVAKSAEQEPQEVV